MDQVDDTPAPVRAPAPLRKRMRKKGAKAAAVKKANAPLAKKRIAKSKGGAPKAKPAVAEVPRVTSKERVRKRKERAAARVATKALAAVFAGEDAPVNVAAPMDDVEQEEEDEVMVIEQEAEEEAAVPQPPPRASTASKRATAALATPRKGAAQSSASARLKAMSNAPLVRPAQAATTCVIRACYSGANANLTTTRHPA